MEVTSWNLDMESKYLNLHDGTYLMELTPWKLSHGTYAMECTSWNLHPRSYLVKFTP